PPGQYPVFVLT
ncbi:hypothetical protein VN97_g7283, partial [Penicillium thymicola]